MRSHATMDNRLADLSRNEVRPVWWILCWGMTAFMTAMFALMFFFPDYAALWLFFLVAGFVAAGMGYKVGKYAQPLPDDPPPHHEE